MVTGLWKRSLVILAITGLTVSCAKQDPASTTVDNETAQQVGDAMASVDESGGSSGSLAMMGEIRGGERMLARLVPGSKPVTLEAILLPEAQAASCATSSTFGSCTSNVITRTFGGCTIGTATLNGTVTLTWNDANNSDNTCAITANGHHITREPNFTLTGPRGGTLTVSKTGTVGQRITRTAAGQFSFSNDGIRRAITTAGGTTLYDFTTETTGSLTITGASRSGRTLTASGGAGLQVTNNRNGVVCTYVPTNVTWTNTCTCATSGSWAATCSDGKSSTVTLNGCGTADFTMGESTTAVTFDRCQSTL